MKQFGRPRVVVLGGGAGLGRVVTGLAGHLCGGDHDPQHDVLTAIVPGAGDMEDAESLVRHCACVLPATVDAGPVRRVHPEALRRIINADLIVAGPCGRATLDEILSVGGMGSTLPAVDAVRVLVTDASEGSSGDCHRDPGRLVWSSQLFDYWVCGSSSPDARDGLIEELEALLAVAGRDGVRRGDVEGPQPVDAISGTVHTGRAIG